MKTIYKYDVPIVDFFTWELPKSAEVLTVQCQYGLPKIWVLLDPEAPKIIRTFHIFGTKHLIPDDLKMKYIGTFQLENGQLIYHLFEGIQ